MNGITFTFGTVQYVVVGRGEDNSIIVQCSTHGHLIYIDEIALRGLLSSNNHAKD
jgi:hypothetical protein